MNGGISPMAIKFGHGFVMRNLQFMEALYKFTQSDYLERYLDV